MPRSSIPADPPSIEALRTTVKILNKFTDGAWLTRRLKTVDGIDELGAGVSQIAGILGKVLSFCVFTAGTLPVYCGTLGMTEEYIEAWDKYKEIIQSQESAAGKIAQLTEFSEYWRNYISKKFELDLSDRPLALDPNKTLNIEEFATELQKWEEARNQEFVAALGKRWGWTGATAMTGMFIALLPNAITNLIQIADKSAPAYESLAQIAKAGSAPATVALGAAGSLAFAGAQPLMVGYGINRVRQGFNIEQSLQQNKQRVSNLNGLQLGTTQDALTEIIDKELYFNRKNYIEYGKITAAGQSSMFIGSMLSLTGAGMLVGIPFSALGAVSTLYAAGSRSINESKQEHYVSQASDYSEEQLKAIGLTTTIDGKPYTIVNDNYVQKAEAAFEEYSQKLAEIKLYSLFNHLINDRNFSNKRKYSDMQLMGHSFNEHTYNTPEEKKKRLAKILKSDDNPENEGQRTRLKGTGLQGDIFKRAREIYNKLDPETLATLLGTDLQAANNALLACIKNCAGSDDISALQQSLLSLEDDEKKTKIPLPTEEEAEPLLTPLPPAKEKPLLQDSDQDIAKLNTKLIQGLKQSFKTLRYSMAGALITAAHCQELQAQIKAEEKRQSAASIASPYTANILHCPSSSFKPEPQQTATPHDISHSYRQLKESLALQDPALQQEKLRHYQQKAVKFAVAREYKEKGNTVKIWHDEKHPDKGPDYQITYITTKKETIIKYGRYVSATITVKGNPKKGVGVRVIEINNGSHAFYGDTRNTQINIEKTGPVHSPKSSKGTFSGMVASTFSQLSSIKETIIKYGRYASAAVTTKSDPKQGVMEVSNGNTRKKQINVEKSSPVHSYKSNNSQATPNRRTFVEMVTRSSSHLPSMFCR